MGKPAEIKTKPTVQSVEEFINGLNDEQQKSDSQKILELMEKVSGENPVMWGASLVGFGQKRYKSERSGREVDWFKIGFSPRKANLSLHLTIDIKKHSAALENLGKHKTGVGCLYINKLSDIDLKVLELLINDAWQMKNVDAPKV